MKKTRDIPYGVGMCSAIIGSSALAMRAQKLLFANKIQSSVTKSTTKDGCVYVLTFLCIHRASVESALADNGIRIRGYL